jgi:hypothetical protein
MRLRIQSSDDSRSILKALFATGTVVDGGWDG